MQIRHAQAVQKNYFDRTVIAKQFSVSYFVLVFNPLLAYVPEALGRAVGFLSKPIASEVTYLLRTIVIQKTRDS